MAPKGKKAAHAAKVKTEGLCIKGVTGKELTNKIARTLPKFPQWVRDYYAGKIRYQKTADSKSKQEFLENLLSGEGMESQFFKRLHETLHETSESTEAEWLSWTAITKVESEAVIKLSLKQHKMERRLSPT